MEHYMSELKVDTITTLDGSPLALPDGVSIEGVTLSGAPTTGQVLTATSPTAATWGTPSLTVTDALTSTSTTTALSAAQGKVLNEGKQAALKRTNAPVRPIGVAAGFAAAIATNFGGKFEAEAPFSRVRFAIYTQAAATNFKMVAAVTETDAGAGTGLYNPTVATTSYNALRADSGSPGWAEVTLDAAASFNTVGGAVTKGYNETVTDWVDLRSIARADGGTRPLVMWRLEHDGAVNGAWTRSSNYDAWLSEASAAPWFRVMRALTGTGFVTTLANTGSITSNGIIVFPEFDYDCQVKSVMCVGDSNIENQGGFATGEFGSWPWQAVMSLSTPTAPKTLVNAGLAGGTSAEFVSNALAEIAAQEPDVVIYCPWTPNDPTMSALTLTQQKIRVASMLAACTAVKAKLLVVTGIPNNTTTGTTDAFRLNLTTHIAALATAGLIEHIDFEATLGTGVSPNRFQATYTSDSGVHLSPAAALVMAPVVAARLALML